MFKKNENVALINIEGTIVGGKGSKSIFGSALGADTITAQLYNIANSDKYRGVIIRVNSPGGSSAASQEIYELIEEVKASGKYVIASMADVAASGGYMISSACDMIVASPSTMTGSIGVVMSLPFYKELAEKLGYDKNVIKAGKFKDIGNPFRDMTVEENMLLHNMVTECHKEFIELVAKGRNMSVDEVTTLATGMVYTGRQAYSNGLVDELGNLYTAVDIMEEKLGVEDINIKEFKTKKGILESVIGLVSMSNIIKTEGITPKMLV